MMMDKDNANANVSSSNEVSMSKSKDKEVVVDKEEVKVKEKSSKKKLDAWSHFTKYMMDGKMRAKCNYCPANYACDSNVNGTSNMNRHLREQCITYLKMKAGEDAKQKCLVKERIISSYIESVDSTSGLGGGFNEEVRKALAEMLIVDELPLRFVEKPGFRNFCHVGMPKFDVPSRRTIVRDIIDLYVNKKISLMSYFKESKVRVCLTTNTWTSIQNINYMVVTAHFIDEHWQLHKNILSFSPITDHRGQTIEKCIVKVLLEWGIERIFTITMDNASSNNLTMSYVKKCLTNWKDGLILGGKYLHLRCCAHIVNLIVTEGLKNVHESVVAIRNAVKFVKSSPSRLEKFKRCVEIEKLPSKSLVVLDVVTRWNSTYVMLASALKLQKAFERMEEEDEHYQNYFIENEDRIGPPKKDDWANAKVFFQFLKTFYDVTIQFSAALSVTSNLYFHKWSTINNQLTSMSRDGNFIVCQMATSLKNKFDKYWGSLENTNKLLIVAVILDPRYKLQYVSYCFGVLYGSACCDSMTTKVKDALIELYDYYSTLHGASSAKDATLNVDDLVGDDYNAGEDGDGNDMFDLSRAFFENMEKEEIVGGMNEVERYLLEPVERKRSYFDILNWWSVSSAQYPILGLIAKDVFAMPVSTMAPEFAFSIGGRVLDQFRSSLTPKMVECLICTQNWLQHTIQVGPLANALALAHNDDTSVENQQFFEDVTLELGEKLCEKMSSTNVTSDVLHVVG